MSHSSIRFPAAAGKPSSAGADGRLLSGLACSVYASASPMERCRMLEALTRPLGLLPLVGLARGVFAKVLLRPDWPEGSPRSEDVREVPLEAVAILMDYLQQRGPEAIAALAPVIADSPDLADCGCARELLAQLTSGSGDSLAPVWPAEGPQIRGFQV